MSKQSPRRFSDLVLLVNQPIEIGDHIWFRADPSVKWTKEITGATHAAYLGQRIKKAGPGIWYVASDGGRYLLQRDGFQYFLEHN